MLAVVDYGAGNLASVVNALNRVGAETIITHDRDQILQADGVIVPGVGAAADTMHHLTALELVEPIRQVIERGTPYLGICMGMQTLLTRSYEGGEHECMNVIPGSVLRLPAGQPIPHMGWNQVTHDGTSPLFRDIPSGAEFYFVHSYYIDPEDETCIGGKTDYQLEFVSAVSRDNMMGTQFHPEKSGHWGLKLLRNFVDYVNASTDRGN